LEKCSNIKFYENPYIGNRVVPCGRTDMTKLIANPNSLLRHLLKETRRRQRCELTRAGNSWRSSVHHCWYAAPQEDTLTRKSRSSRHSGGFRSSSTRDIRSHSCKNTTMSAQHTLNRLYLCFVYFLFVYNFTDHCHRVERPLQLINSVTYKSRSPKSHDKQPEICILKYKICSRNTTVYF